MPHSMRPFKLRFNQLLTQKSALILLVSAPPRLAGSRPIPESALRGARNKRLGDLPVARFGLQRGSCSPKVGELLVWRGARNDLGPAPKVGKGLIANAGPLAEIAGQKPKVGT